MGRKEEKTDVLVGNLGKYKILERLGKGGRGVVYKALLLTEGLHVAVKRVLRLQLTAEEERALQEEIDLLKNLQDEFVVNYYEVIDNPESQYVDIVMEYVEGGSLEQFVMTVAKVERASKASGGILLEERLVAKLVQQILMGLDYLHQQGVIHRDIKCANILMTKDRRVKLSDFGVSVRKRFETTTENLEVVGTPYWMAPEIIALTGLSTESDIWSLGCTLVELLTGEPPYGDLNEFNAMYRIVTDDRPPLPPDLSPALESFLLGCFQKDMMTRPSADELLKHPWITENCEDNPTPKPYATSVHVEMVEHDLAVIDDDDIFPLETDNAQKFALAKYEDTEDEFDEWEELEMDDLSHQVSFNKITTTESMSTLVELTDSFFDNEFEDDPIAENEKERARREKDQWEKMKKVAQRLLENNVQARIDACKALNTIFEQQPTQKSNFLVQPGLLVLLENLESSPFEDEDLLDAVLMLVNSLINESTRGMSMTVSRAKSLQYTAAMGLSHTTDVRELLSLSGFIPVIIPFCGRVYSVFVRLSAARFLRRMTELEATMRSLCACGGSIGFISCLESDLSSEATLEMTGIALAGLSAILRLADRSFFTRRMSHDGALERLGACIQWMCDHDPDVTKYTQIRLEAAGVMRIFAERSDPLIKRRLSKKEVLGALVRTLDAPMEVALEPSLELFLASLLDLSRDPSSHEHLQNAGAIPRLVRVLDHYHASYADHSCSTLVPKMMTQVICTLSNLCRVSTKRQELACVAGIIPHLQWFIQHAPLMHMWSLDLYAGLAAVSNTARAELWKHDGLNFYVSLLNNETMLLMYVAKILQSLSEWLEDDKERVEKGLLESMPGSEKGGGQNVLFRLVRQSQRTIRGGADAALEPVLKMMQLSAPLCRWFMSDAVLKEIIRLLPKAQAHVQTILLRILQAAHTADAISSPTMADVGLNDALKELTGRNAITVKEQAGSFLRALHSEA